MKRKCPRCEGLVMQSYDSESPTCVACGWTDYSYTAPRTSRRGVTRHVASDRLRYVGTGETDVFLSTNQRNRRWAAGDVVRDYVVTVVASSVPREGGLGERLLVTPLCPFCEDAAPMAKQSYRERRSTLTIVPYICPSRHVIRLVSASESDGLGGYLIGWK
jgi:hypothetical protein